MNHNGFANVGFVLIIAFVAMHVCADFFYNDDDDSCEECELPDKSGAYHRASELASFGNNYFKFVRELNC
jgi:hypothetical protein